MEYFKPPADSLQRFASGDNTQSSSNVDPKTTDDDDLKKNVDEIDETHEQLVDALKEAKDKYLELTNALKQKQRAEDTISKLLEENPSFLTAIDSDAKSETINSQDTLTDEGGPDDASQDDMDEENTTLTEEGDEEYASPGDIDEEDDKDDASPGDIDEERDQGTMSKESQGNTTNSFDKGAPEEFDQSPREDN